MKNPVIVTKLPGIYKEFGDKLLERVEEELSDIAKIDAEKKFEGRSLTMTMASK